MLSVRSIVAIDLEFTGGILPKVTELAMVACERNHLVSGKELPRILHKLVMPVNPMKPITSDADKVSGLSNAILENSKPFDNGLVKLIKNFLERLPQPVCLVAHNGRKFDFPILRRELINCLEPFPETIYCADSKEAFKKIFLKSGIEEEDAACVSAVGKLEKAFGASDPILMALKQTMNESTPKSAPNEVNSLNNEKETDVCRRSNLNESGPVSVSDKNSIDAENSSPSHFSFVKIYKFFHDGKMFQDAHRAESDAGALLSCIAKSGKEFLEYLDQNAVLLSEIPPMK